MNNTVLKFAIYSLVGMMLFSCDIVEGPYMNEISGNTDTGEVVQKVLLEEFTGHQCPNCPAGALVAKQLENLYGNKFIVIAYHTGFFANTSGSFPADYRTAIGDEFRTIFGVNTYPSGLINRRNGMVMGPTEWSTTVSEVILQEPKLKLIINRTYNNSTRQLSVTVSAEALESLTSMKLSVFITESGLVSPQKTSNDPNYPNGVIPDYTHNHVFRGSLNGTWGTQIFDQGALEGSTESVSLNGTISENWVAANIEIVCFAYDSETGEIVQVESKKLL
jgi:thiol-disulfide isomerase/thioredoxin